MQGQVPRPSQHEPSLEKPLEAICLKAMAKGAEDRYATPRAMAEDLERWLADEPVTAWREPFSQRARRWARRNRTAVVSLAASVLVALAGTAAVLAVQTQANGRLKQANSELVIANGRVANANAELSAANNREKERFRLAMDAIKLFHGEVSADLLMKESQFDGLRTKLLKGAADFYGRLEDLLEGQTDRESRGELGKAYEQLGRLTVSIGDQTAALAVLGKALDGAQGAGVRAGGGCRVQARRGTQLAGHRLVAANNRRPRRGARLVRGGTDSNRGNRRTSGRDTSRPQRVGKSLPLDRPTALGHW